MLGWRCVRGCGMVRAGTAVQGSVGRFEPDTPREPAPLRRREEGRESEIHWWGVGSDSRAAESVSEGVREPRAA